MYPLDVQFALEDMDADQKACFDYLVADGQSPRAAVMFTLQAPPQSKTDTAIGIRFGANEGQFADDQEGGKMLVDCAKKFDPNFSPTGKVYVGGLARACGGPGHPQAWVDPSNFRAEVQAVCREKGLNSEGAVDYKAPVKDEYLAEKPYRVDDKVVTQHVLAAVQADPSLRGKRDLVERIRDKITPKDLK